MANQGIADVVRQLAEVVQNLAQARQKPKNLRVNSVVYYLRGEADMWWQRGNNGGNRNNNNHNNNNGNGNQSGNNGLRSYVCRRCPMNHHGKDCDDNLVVCRFCSKLGHREFEFYSMHGKPNQNNNQNKDGNNNGNANGGGYNKGNAQGKLNVITMHEAETSSAVIAGLSEPEKIEVTIVTPTGSILKFTKIHNNVSLTIAKTIFSSNLIEFELGELDVILGMDWLAMLKAKIDCEK
ncbi:uncharacterized protein [Spinacia oleracea]|uniref:CCHC-type domain-containing protein n=1 Tax=Spinacia oleracea TaxID=3562 RepID=A0ABM3R3P0_SPIOL|nr:uncharacterized protein LOC130465484 [Spinacia oleracea]